MNMFELMDELKRVVDKLTQLPDDHALSLGLSFAEHSKRFGEFLKYLDDITDTSGGALPELEGRLDSVYPEEEREAYYQREYEE